MCNPHFSYFRFRIFVSGFLFLYFCIPELFYPCTAWTLLSFRSPAGNPVFGKSAHCLEVPPQQFTHRVGKLVEAPDPSVLLSVDLVCLIQM